MCTVRKLHVLSSLSGSSVSYIYLPLGFQENKDFVYLVMEYGNGGDLCDYMSGKKLFFLVI